MQGGSISRLIQMGSIGISDTRTRIWRPRWRPRHAHGKLALLLDRAHALFRDQHPPAVPAAETPGDAMPIPRGRYGPSGSTNPARQPFPPSTDAKVVPAA
jgi:hypothetical protein